MSHGKQCFDCLQFAYPYVTVRNSDGQAFGLERYYHNDCKKEILTVISDFIDVGDGC